MEFLNIITLIAQILLTANSLDCPCLDEVLCNPRNGSTVSKPHRQQVMIFYVVKMVLTFLCCPYMDVVQGYFINLSLIILFSEQHNKVYDWFSSSQKNIL